MFLQFHVAFLEQFGDRKEDIVTSWNAYPCNKCVWRHLFTENQFLYKFCTIQDIDDFTTAVYQAVVERFFVDFVEVYGKSFGHLDYLRHFLGQGLDRYMENYNQNYLLKVHTYQISLRNHK